MEYNNPSTYPFSTSIIVQNFIHNAASINNSSIFMGRLQCVSPFSFWVICTWMLVPRSSYSHAFVSWGCAEQKNHEVSREVFGSSASPSTCSLCFTHVLVPCLVCSPVVLRGQQHLWAGQLGSPFTSVCTLIHLLAQLPVMARPPTASDPRAMQVTFGTHCYASSVFQSYAEHLGKCLAFIRQKF